MFSSDILKQVNAARKSQDVSPLNNPWVKANLNWSQGIGAARATLSFETEEVNYKVSLNLHGNFKILNFKVKSENLLDYNLAHMSFPTLAAAEYALLEITKSHT